MRLPAALLLALLLPATAAAGPDVYATGWNGGTETHYLKGDGHGVTLYGGARTEYRFRSLRSARDTIVSWNPLWQSFSFGVRDDRARSVVSFETSVRGGVDLDSGDFRGEVLYAYVDLSPPAGWARLRVGRQLLSANGQAGFTRFDGVAANLALHHLGLEAYAGVLLRSRAFVVPDGEELDTGWGKDWTWGVALSAVNLRDTQVRIGFQDRMRGGSLTRRHLTIDVHKGILQRVNVRGNLSVDLLHQRLQDVLAAVEGRPLPWLKAGFEYEHWQPSFDADTIWSVFATDPYDSITGSLHVAPVSWISAHISGGAQIYPKAVSQDDVPFADLGEVSGSQRAGVTLRPTDFLEFTVDERLVSGVGGQKVGVAVVGRVTPWGGKLDLSVRGDVQDYAFDLQPGLAGTYGGLALEVGGRPTGWVRGSVRAEYIFTPFLQNNLQVSATLDLLLGVRIHKGAGGVALDELQPAMLASSGRALPLNRKTLPGLDGGMGVTGALR